MTETDAKAIIDVAQQAAVPHLLGEGMVYSVVVPEGYQAQIMDDRETYDRRADNPRRTKGTAQLTRQESFVAYVMGQSDGEPLIYADERSHMIQAVFNPSRPGEPGWGDHRARLSLQFTPEWEAWTGRHNVLTNQTDFAEFIEDNRRNVVDPDGATLLEMVQSFEAATNVQFKSATRLKDGQRQLTYVENTTATGQGTAGQVEFPDSFLLELGVFEGLEPVPVGARVRYRLGGGQLKIGFILDDTETILRSAFDAVLAAVEQDTGLVAYHGSPPS